MARVAIQATCAHFDAVEALRALIVCACALALIAAGQIA
jgi:hypothetical protein